MRPVIIVFAKTPAPGRVKTRLTPAFEPAVAVALHTAFVRDTFQLLESLSGIAELQLHTETATTAWPELGVPRCLQSEGDLGLKMLKALANSLEEGRPRALILGSDSPTLPPTHLESLLDLDADVALGPTADGGFYAIAARRTHSAMFDGVRWSSPHALADTIRSCRACGLSTAAGPEWFDIDTPDDIEALWDTVSVPRHTAEVLAALKRTPVNGRQRA